MPVCPSCGQENPDIARFCLACGAELGSKAAQAREERKVVTVLFCDLVGSTARAEQMDPEDVRALLSSYHEHVRAELERLGGTVEKFVGDAVMALFGAPTAHEDDAERAVRAALAIREWAQEGGDLQVRIGITTGEALVALGARLEAGEGMAAGDVVNTAARLQGAAPTDGILVDETTYRATERVIEYDQAMPVDAKGKAEPVPVWHALEARARLGVDVRQIGGTALVGRERELDLLWDALERARGEREPQLVTVVGVPGIGKSRLVWELLQRVDAEPEFTTWRQGRSLPYGEGVSFWALAEIVKAQAGILESDSGEAAVQKLQASVAELDLENPDWTLAHVRQLVGVGDESAPAENRRAEAFAAWRFYLEGVAASDPLVLVFEDLHWADDGLLDFVDELVEWTGGVPLLVLATARPELLARRPGWGGGKANAATVSLSPLTEEETARLVHALLERAVLPAETQSALLERAEGNPLYAEEFARLLAERAGGEAVSVPESVHALIAARLDTLSSDEKTLLQDAAVTGKVFWSGALAALGSSGEARVDTVMHALVRREFVRRERRSSVAGQTEYAFRHVLVRDVAYRQIPRASRAIKHQRAAEWIVSLGRIDDRAELVAHHYATALELAGAAGQPTGELAERARSALRTAADRASALNAFSRAASLYEDAIALWPEDDPERPGLLLRQGMALRWASDSGDEQLAGAAADLVDVGDREAAVEALLTLSDLAFQRDADMVRALRLLDEAAALVEASPPSRGKALVLSRRARIQMLQSEFAEAVRSGGEALAIADAIGLDDVKASTLNTIGVARVKQGDRIGIGDQERGLALANEIGHGPEIMRGYNNLGASLEWLGDLTRFRTLFEEALEAVRRFGEPTFARWLLANHANDLLQRGEWDRALALADEFIAEAEELATAQEMTVRSVRADIRFGRGDADGALEDARRALALGRGLGDPQSIGHSLATLAWILYEQGENAEAAEAIEEIHQLARDRDPFAATPCDGIAVAVELNRGDELTEIFANAPNIWLFEAARSAAADRFEAAAEIYERTGWPTSGAQARLIAARRLARQGRHAEAAEPLERALAFYRSVGATRYVEQGEALLAKTA